MNTPPTLPAGKPSTPTGITRALNRVLHKVTQPARYTGGELNSVVKDWADPAIRIKLALCFPDIYELGGSNLGTAILYDLVNRRPDLLAERAFCPWPDFEALMRRDGIPLYGLETRHPLDQFDIVGFSLPYEQLYTNVLTMLDLAGLPLRAAERSAAQPLVIAGGSGCYNPEPMSAFFDAMVIGEGEEVIFEVIATYEAWRAERDAGTLLPAQTAPAGVDPLRYALWERLAAVRGVYVPGLYRRGLRRRRHGRCGNAGEPGRAGRGRQARGHRPAAAAHPLHRPLHQRRPQPRRHRDHARLHARLPLLPGGHDLPAGARAQARGSAGCGRRHDRAVRL